jgi:endonuclease/exonuclease/phosphatase (EEP) superfamily protein YafD
VLRRTVTFILLLAVACVLVVLAFPQVVGWQQHYYVAQLIAFRGVLVAVGVVLFVILLLIGLIVRPVRGLFGGAATLLLVFALVNAGVVFERGTGADRFHDPVTGTITVLSWNTEGGKPGATAIADLAVTNHADVVSLPETTAATAKAVAAEMAKDGHPVTVLTLAYDQTDTAKSTSLLIRKTLGEYTMSTDQTTTEILPTVIAKPTSGKGPEIIAVHSVAPVHQYMPQWRHDLRYLASLCADKNAILAGDFNSTLDHLAGLGTGSAALGTCRDAAFATANAGVGTWPTSVPPLAGTPIDHVMTTSDWSVAGFQVLTDEDAAGSDHRPIVARLNPKDIAAAG